ncbi:MAG: hypothetical protein NT062_28580, partial [Proteobacteria bacterium]|nr:hypothetical protein [Pseudomonadota bacterium]
ALALATTLPAIDPVDAIERDDLIAAAQRGRRQAQGYVAAWIAVAAIGAFLAGSLVLAARRARQRPRLPTELLFLAPVAAVLVGVSFTAHRLIAPAVLTISAGGLVLAALSGAILDLARSRGRIALHAVLSTIAIVALVYIALMRDNLFDMLLETIRFGPES